MPWSTSALARHGIALFWTTNTHLQYTMPQTESRKLDSDDNFPSLNLDLTNGEQLTLPTGKWTVLLLYRGYW